MDVSQFPTSEDDEYEFKSSRTPIQELKKKMPRAVSGFANSGGGVFVAGVNGTGDPDGGFPDEVGRAHLGDWVDKIIHEVEPAPSYTVSLLDEPMGRGSIDDGRHVIAVQVPASLHGPHMAPDKKYYIRAGAHTVPARHFIVESIWARRNLATPRLVHLASLQGHTNVHSFLNLEVVAVTDAPALDVQISVSPEPDPRYFSIPLKVPVIDRSHPFTFRFEVPNSGINCSLSVGYSDIAGNKFEYNAGIATNECFSAYSRGPDPLRDIARAIAKLGN